MSDLSKLLIRNNPVQCECGGKLIHIGSGKYECPDCGNITLDDFGKVKAYLEENGPTPVRAIARATKIPPEVISTLLKAGRVEITENSSYYIKCESCGCSIRSGRLCITCAKELSPNIRHISFNEIGDKPKQHSEIHGKMHFLSKDSKSFSRKK